MLKQFHNASLFPRLTNVLFGGLPLRCARAQ
jgi:hypothetical protein